MDAGSTGLLRQPRNQLLDLLADDHHQVGEFVDHDDDVRQWIERRHCAFVLAHGKQSRDQRIGHRLAGLLCVAHLAVETTQVPDTQFLHQLVTPLHLGDAPAKRIGRLLHVGHDRRQQVRDALVDRQLEHLRIDHDQAHLLSRALVKQRQHHGVDRDRLAGTGGPRDQQVRHPREVHDDRRATDILAERECERRSELVIGTRADDLAERDQFTRFVRNFQAHDRLAGYHLDDPHADRRKRAREVLGERADLAHLHAGCGLQFEAGDDGARQHGDDLDIHAEIFQLDLDQPRDRIERLGRIGLLARRRIVEQLELRKILGGRLCEQLDLSFLLDTLARLRWRGGFDARRRACPGLFLHFAYQRLARLARFPAGGLIALGRHAIADPRGASQHPVTDEIHHPQPGDAGVELHAREPQGKHQERRAQQRSGGRKALADQVAKDAAGPGRQCASREVQRRKTAARPERGDQSDRAQRNRRAPLPGCIGRTLESDPGAEADRQRKQECRPAKEHQQEAGDPGAQWPDQVADLAWLTRITETAVVGVEARERDHQHQRERGEQPERGLAQGACENRIELGFRCGSVGGGLGHGQRILVKN